ncbi:MAG: OstA-like protein [Bacillota bacterium]|jgi:lipopolysaccharide assembly outer membrane protein LptD (OstA)|nr:OstA-like protein [Bacillota bacterium]NLU55672.1 LPS export ABC transporter periplasmic protein LptC [Bacillota bacterium]HOA90263.1 OstA-like protein [Bacillota bacterium]HPQ10933.1 OstA-like protein [Bacillota bacterium]HPT60000.1 OstA-like protein [Bacillota bacterium]
MKRKALFFLLVFTLILSWTALAQKDNLVFTVSEDGEMVGGEGDEITVTGSKIVITQGKTQITTQKLIYNTKTKVARAFGRCIIVNDNMTITADEVFFDTENDYARLIGSVQVVQERDKTLTIDADEVELWTETKDVKAEGNIVINDTEKTIYGDTLEFSDGTGIAKLIGNLKLVEEDRILTSPNGVLETNVDKGTYKVTGPIEFVTKVN